MLHSYLKLAWKVLLRRKFFTFASLFGVAFTLLVLTVAAALLDDVFAPHPPETRMARTLGLYGMGMTGPESSRTSFAGWPFVKRYMRDLPGAEKVALLQLQHEVDSYPHGQKLTSYLKRTDGAFWQVLDFHFLEGQPFTEDDERQARRVAVINETTRSRFFSNGHAVGRTIEMDGQRFRVVGVVEDVPFLRVVPFADVWVPISTARSDSYKREYVGDFFALVLADPARMDELRREFAARVAAARPPDPHTFTRFYGGLESLFEFVSRLIFAPHFEEAHTGSLLGVLAGLALLFMLLPAINLVNLNLSRILERTGEIGVRKAFGASSWTLVGQFVVESLVLSLLGGALGVLLSGIVLWALNGSGLIPYAQLTLNPRVFLWGLAFSAAFGLLSGVYPAWRMSRLHPVEALRGRPQ
ncbi:MAG TPA: ABC transporter permease [Thermoanaerobaculia bacterium]|jgi:putative ABC transport system permease protein|nr:ABC transporter permease [Thermoanaerobaculia bacterium]